jgi:hypothetical protein
LSVVSLIVVVPYTCELSGPNSTRYDSLTGYKDGRGTGECRKLSVAIPAYIRTAIKQKIVYKFDKDAVRLQPFKLSKWVSLLSNRTHPMRMSQTSYHCTPFWSRRYSQKNLSSLAIGVTTSLLLIVVHGGPSWIVSQRQCTHVG